MNAARPHPSILSAFEREGVSTPAPPDERFRVLLDCIRDPGRGLTLLDFGCGASNLYDYIQRNDLSVIEYSGLDLSRRALARARQRFPDIRYYDTNVLDPAAPRLPAFDYVILNDVFRYKGALSDAQMLDYARALLHRVLDLATIGIAFNVRSLPTKRDDLFHVPVGPLTDLLVRKVGAYTVVRHDYALDETTAYVYKERAAARFSPIGSAPAKARRLNVAAAEQLDISQSVIDAARSDAELDPEFRTAFEEYRTSDAYRLVYEKKEPLVSVCICTYNRARLLVERAIPSVLTQDYSNLEVIVVGDGCTDETGDAIARIGDRRITFVNIPRGRYPEHPGLRWLAAGTVPANHSLTLVTGDFITHLDDDDEFVPDRISKLVGHIQQTGAEFVWHPFRLEVAPDKWVEWPANELEAGQVTTGSVMYLSWFKRLPVDTKAYLYLEPGDWNRFRKLKYLGTKVSRYPEPLLRHYAERTQHQIQKPGGSRDKPE